MKEEISLHNCEVVLTKTGLDIDFVPSSFSEGEVQLIQYLRKNQLLDYEAVIDQFFGGSRAKDILSLQERGLVRLLPYPEDVPILDVPKYEKEEEDTNHYN